MSKKKIAVLGSGASWHSVCVEAFVKVGYEVQTEGLNADGYIVFDLFPHNLQKDMVAADIQVPIFWISLFEIGLGEPITSLKDVTFKLVPVNMNSELFFKELADLMKEKVPLH